MLFIHRLFVYLFLFVSYLCPISFLFVSYLCLTEIHVLSLPETTVPSIRGARAGTTMDLPWLSVGGSGLKNGHKTSVNIWPNIP